MSHESLSYEIHYRNSAPKFHTIIGATTSETVNLLECSYEYLISLRPYLISSYGRDAYEWLLVKSAWQAKSPILFSDFCEFYELRNNFFMFFFDNFIGEMYRTQWFYIRFASENNPLNTKLMEIFSKGPLWRNVTKKQKELLYEAYLIMIKYDEVKNNQSLFV